MADLAETGHDGREQIRQCLKALVWRRRGCFLGVGVAVYGLIWMVFTPVGGSGGLPYDLFFFALWFWQKKKGRLMGRLREERFGDGLSWLRGEATSSGRGSSPKI